MPKNTAQSSPPLIPLVFAILLAAHVLAALYSPIQDCDETYNYWEPSHYLNHGYGLQTWEYSPLYAIRSWLYAALHSILIYLLSTLMLSPSKPVEFYALRCGLAMVCAGCETRLYAMVCRTMNVRIGILFVIVCASSAGMFHAGMAYLPSSFAMYTVTLAMADFMERGAAGDKTWRGLTWLAFGTIVGWPFVAVLALPFVIEEVVSGGLTGVFWRSVRKVFDAAGPSLAILAIETAVDTIFYRRMTSVPFNIVQYNVLSTSGGGPDIYGVEPWHFYVRNLLINFNFWYLLALLSLPLLLVHRSSTTLAAPKFFSRSLALMSPFYIWFAIFTLQPHKEERFMYPIYPCLALNAATALHLILVDLSNPSPNQLVGRVPASLKLLSAIFFVAVSALLGMWRSAGLVTAYSAPLSIYRSLHGHPVISTNPHTIFNICVGKEWYRFPSSYHLPSNSRLKFIKSEFRGLLPGEFAVTSPSGGFYPATWMTPAGMNDQNIEDPGKYTNLKYCHFLVDSSFPDPQPSEREPDFTKDQRSWEQVECRRFLDSLRSSLVARLFWIPDSKFVPHRFRRRWGQYCLLGRKSSSP